MKHQLQAPDVGTDPLWEVFHSPPDDARPRAWWHWLDGNVDPAGIERDLRWLHGVGVRGVQLFDGGLGGAPVVPVPVRPGSEAWRHAVDVAVRATSELGMELAVATSSGWSAAGGPWVRPGDAMKKVVWSELEVTGGRTVEALLPPLPATTGLHQDSPRWGAAADAAGYAVDWRVVAFPADPSHRILKPERMRASAPVADWTCLTDGSFGPTIALPRDPDGWSTAWIEQQFAHPVTVRSVVVGLPGPRGFGAAPPASGVLQASDDGVEFRDVAQLPASSTPARTVAFPAVTARVFRLVLEAASAAEALPPVGDGVRLPPVLRASSSFEISEFALRTAGRVNDAEVKAGFGVVADYYAVATDPRADAASIDPSTVIDVSEFLHDGMLRWDAPPGDWTILRLGASLTGQTNGPAPADATGLEVDKLDGARVRSYLETHLRRFDVDGGSSQRFAALLSDSIESGPQNWTDAIHEHVEKLRGYDPLPWLPTLAGHLVGGPEASDRFLYDYRRTIAELIAREYYGTLAAEAHRRGMAYYAEALEDRRPQLGDDLAMRAHADVPMGAMWTFDPADGPRPTYVADLKGASSVAHVTGKRWVGAEAFTSFDQPWAWTPRSLKHIADLQLTLGVTRFCIHTSPHQPIAAQPPGLALAPFLGQAFTVNETWAAFAGPWIDYLARCAAILNAGTPAVDVAVFVGEEAPVTGLYGHGFDTTVPDGFDFDYVGVDALADVLRVAGGTIVAEGAAYRVLFLGGSSRRMTLAALRAVERLLDAGATVVGLRPLDSPSLADDPDDVRGVCDRIWAPSRTRGRMIATADLASALAELDIRPAIEIDGPPVRRIGRVVDGRLVTFVANGSPDAVQVRVLPADGGALVAWDPVEVRAMSLPQDERSRTAGRAAFLLSLPPFGSSFVLPAGAVKTAATTTPPQTRTVPLHGDWRLEVPGSTPVVQSPHPRLWTELERARGFSGVAVYRTDIELTAEDLEVDRVVIDLGDVCDIARVHVNGQDCGVAWTAPFRLDVSAAVRAGINRIDIEVATPWRNRLIAEATLPSGEISDPLTAVFEPTARPLPAGLAGPVELRLVG